jgi:hypothetical protein
LSFVYNSTNNEQKTTKNAVVHSRDLNVTMRSASLVTEVEDGTAAEVDEMKPLAPALPRNGVLVDESCIYEI